MVASKLGALVQGPEGVPFEKANKRTVADFRECAAFGKDHGVVVGLPQPNDFLKTGDETVRWWRRWIPTGLG